MTATGRSTTPIAAPTTAISVSAARRRRCAGSLLVLAILVAACGGGGSAVPSSPARPDSPVPQLEPCESTTELAAAPDGPPDVSLTCLTSDEQLRLAAYRVRPTLVNLWASWCTPCRTEMPLLQASHERAGDAVRFLGVNVSDERSSALNFLAVAKISYPQAVDPSNLLPSRLGSQGLPVTIVIDATGAVVYRKIGQLSETDLQQALAAAGA